MPEDKLKKDEIATSSSEDTAKSETRTVEKDIAINIPILTKIQNELKAPKNQYSRYGDYNYRSAEDIESALKPLLLKYGATMYITENVSSVGERVYLAETVHYKDNEQTVEVTGVAREPLTKKKLDDSQITGSTSSYATKYALCKLFLIDDTKDADGTQSSQDAQQSGYSSARRQNNGNQYNYTRSNNYGSRSQNGANNANTQNIPKRQAETPQQREAKAKQYSVNYDGKKVKLYSLIKIEDMNTDSGKKAKAFISLWRKSSAQNERVYQFLKKLN